MRASILLHIQWRDGHTSHVWAKTSNCKDTLGRLLMGQRDATKKAFDERAIMIPKVMLGSDIADCRDWLSAEAVCTACSILSVSLVCAARPLGRSRITQLNEQINGQNGHDRA